MGNSADPISSSDLGPQCFLGPVCPITEEKYSNYYLCGGKKNTVILDLFILCHTIVAGYYDFSLDLCVCVSVCPSIYPSIVCPSVFHFQMIT